VSPLWQIFSLYYQAFENGYGKLEKNNDFFRATIGESVHAFLKYGDFKRGFAGIRCLNCVKERLRHFSAKTLYLSFLLGQTSDHFRTSLERVLSQKMEY